MDIIATLKDRDISKVLHPTMDAFRPLLEANRAEIQSVRHATFKFGAADRQQLDAYYPPAGTPTTGGNYPVLVFAYGGGYFSGWRVYPPPNDLLYLNYGAYFAKRGFVTIIPDYRLVSEGAKFPEPMEDVRDAIAWTVSHAAELTSEIDAPADVDNIFAMGCSAGSVTVSTLLLHPTLLPPDLRPRIKGIILQSGEYRFTPEQPCVPLDVLFGLYGSWDGVYADQPVGLLARAGPDIIQGFPNVLFQLAENEPDEVVSLNEEFAPLLKAKTGRDVGYYIMKGHNHISPHWALCTGRGEEWAVEAELWIKARVAGK